jgi:hypothetical protein
MATLHSKLAYETTLKWVEHFTEHLKEVEAGTGVEPKLHAFRVRSITTYLRQLTTEIKEYEYEHKITH